MTFRTFIRGRAASFSDSLPWTTPLNAANVIPATKHAFKCFICVTPADRIAV
jgi:hypothetical protein